MEGTMAQEPREAMHSEESTIVSTTTNTTDHPVTTTSSNNKKRKNKKATTVEPPSYKRSKPTPNDASNHPKTPTTNSSSPYSNASSSSSHVVDEFELASAVALASLANAACASQPLATPSTSNEQDKESSVTQTPESFGAPTTRGPTTHHDPTTLSPSRPQPTRPTVRTASSKEEELSIASASQEGGEDGLPAPVTPEKRTGYGETTSHQDASHHDSSTLEDSKSTTSATSTTAATTVATTSTTTTPHRRVHFAPNVKEEVTGVPLPHHRSHHPLHPYHHPRHVTHHPHHQLHHHSPHHAHHSHAQMVQRLQLPSSTPNASPPILYRTNSSASSPSRILPPPPPHAHLSPHSYPRAPSSSSSFHTRVHSWPPPPRSSYPGATFLPPPPARPAVPPLPSGEASGATTTATTTTSASTVTGDNNNTNTANPSTTPNAWVCDYCHAASFATYQEACLHEETCSVRLATLAASGGTTSTTPATMTQLRPPLLRTASSSSSSSSSLSSPQHHPWPPSSPVGTTRTAGGGGGGPLLVYSKGHSSPTRGPIGRLAPPPPPPRAFLPLLSHSAPAEAGPAHDPSSLAFGGSPPVRMTTNSSHYHHPKSSSTMVRSPAAAVAPGSNQWYTGFIALGIPEKDSEWLSPLQCLIRRECVQAFSAQESHVQAIRPKSRIALHQVGIACRFCQTHDKKQQQEPEGPKAAATKDPQDTSSTNPETEQEEEETQESWNAPQGTTKALETTTKDSSSFVAFPSSLSGILESVQRWHEEHAPHCPHIPSAVSSQLQRLAQDTQTRSTGTTTTTGKTLKESTQTSQDHEETPKDTDQTREPTLETPEPSELDTSTPSKDSKTKSESNRGDPGPTAPTYSLSVRQYWMDSAKALGMVDTLDGIRFVQDPRTCKPNLVELDASMKYLKPRGGSSLTNADNPAAAGGFGTTGREPLNPHAQDSAQPYAQARATISSQAGVPQHQPPSETTTGGVGSGDYIVHSKDAGIVPPYVYFLMRQVEPCNFTEADRFVARSKGPVGYPGFQCRHCHGHAGLGKYFPVSSKSLSTNSTSQNIHAHLLKCRSCPLATKSHLVALKEEKAKAPRLEPGWRKVFFDKIWIRLHGTPPDPR